MLGTGAIASQSIAAISGTTNIVSIAQSLVLTQTLTESKVITRALAQRLTLAQAVVAGNLTQRLSQGLSLSQTVGGRDVPALGISQNLNIVQNLILNRIINVTACSCLTIVQDLRRAIEVSVSQSLTIKQSFPPAPIRQFLNIVQSVSTNAIEGDCCRGVYLPDKGLSHSLAIHQTVSLNRVINVSVAQSLSILQTVAYRP